MQTAHVNINKEERGNRMYIIQFIRGFCMALADSVPGVSGGTVAFLLGFYDQFIDSIDDLITGNMKKRKQRFLSDQARYRLGNRNGSCDSDPCKCF